MCMAIKSVGRYVADECRRVVEATTPKERERILFKVYMWVIFFGFLAVA